MAAKKGFRFISSSWLKIIAAAAMVIDHGSVIFLGAESTVFRCIGRIAFPLYAFMIAEGALRSKNKLKYALRLLLFAFISEVPFDWGFHGVVFETESQNVFFTLLLGLLSVSTYYWFRERKAGFVGIFTTILYSFGAYFLRSDYGFMGVTVITLMGVFLVSGGNVKTIGYGLSAAMTSLALVPPLAVGFLPTQLYAVFSVIPLSLYNGKRGFRMNKYFFYIFYPAHILVLALIKKYIS